MPKTTPNITPADITKADFKAMVSVATKLGLLPAIKANNEVGIESHLVALSMGYDTPAHALLVAAGFVRELQGNDHYAGYTGTPKAIWLTANGLPYDMGGVGRERDTLDTTNSYYPANASRRKGLPAGSKFKCEKHNERWSKCTSACKVALFVNGAITGDGQRATDKKALQVARLAITKAFTTMGKGNPSKAEAEALIAKATDAMATGSASWRKATTKRIDTLKGQVGIVARGNGRTAQAAPKLTPAERMAKAAADAVEVATS